MKTFGVKGSALPIVAVNGGPGLSHAYMMQNDLWERRVPRRSRFSYPLTTPWVPHSFAEAGIWFFSFRERVGFNTAASTLLRNK
jgi:hypothetical protein